MMTYIKDLKSALDKTSLSEQEKKEVLDEHESMLADALAAGLDEKAIQDKFGDPKKIAEALDLDHVKEAPKTSAYTFDVIEQAIDVTLNLVDEDVHVVPISDNHIKLNFKTKDIENHYDISFVDGHLKVLRKDTKGFQLFNHKKVGQQIDIYLPKAVDITLFKSDTVSGDFEIKGFTINHGNFHTVNGDMNLRQLELESLSLDAVSGDLTLKQLSISTCDINTVNGDVDLEEVAISGAFNLETVNGDVSIKDATCDLLTISTVNGDVDGIEFYPKAIKYDSVNGDLKIKNETTKDIKVISKSSVNGDILLHI